MWWYLKDNSILIIINYGIRKLKIMECPFCGEEMKNGFVRSGGATHPAPAYMCDTCKKVILDTYVTDE